MKVICFIGICLALLSCHQSIDINNSLSQGLDDLKNKRKIDKPFIDGFEIKEIAIIKENDSIGYIIFKLNEDIEQELVNPYRMGVLFHFDETNSKIAGLKTGINKKSFDFAPKIEIHNHHKYAINKIVTKAKKVEEITLYIYMYDGQKITKLEKNKIHIKNIILL